jgi:hydrogenase/urease accessory protein HupE
MHALSPAIALAHTGDAETSGLLYGLAHPVSGIDHVVAMVAVGLLSVHLAATPCCDCAFGGAREVGPS